jgi:hypothetical protein
VSDVPQTLDTLRALAAVDPDFPPFVELHSELARVEVAPDTAADLTRTVFQVLQQMPDRSVQLQRLKPSDRRSSFDAGVASVPLLLTAAFLLRTHIRIERKDRGTWSFVAEYKPADSQLVRKLLETIVQLITHK